MTDKETYAIINSRGLCIAFQPYNPMDKIEQLEQENAELKAENKRLKFKLDTVEADYEASEIEIENLKNKLNFLIMANNHLLELDKYRQKELETKAEATKSNIHNLALLSKANKTLQEIKEIADARCNECKYGKDGISCKYGDCGEAKLHLITQLITKAEEE